MVIAGDQFEESRKFHLAETHISPGDSCPLLREPDRAREAAGAPSRKTLMKPADIYQRRAVECFALADQIADPQERGVMRELALCWLRLLRASESRQQAASRDRAAV
jgi:hypothetical protein